MNIKDLTFLKSANGSLKFYYMGHRISREKFQQLKKEIQNVKQNCKMV